MQRRARDVHSSILPSRLEHLARQSVGGGKFIQKRGYPRSPLLKTTALKGKLTFGNPFLDSGVVSLQVLEGVPASWASHKLTDYSQVDILGVRYKTINFWQEKSPDAPN